MEPTSRPTDGPTPVPSAAELKELLDTLVTTSSFRPSEAEVVPTSQAGEATADPTVPGPGATVEVGGTSDLKGAARRKAYLQALIPEPWRAILRRAAVPRVIDRDLFETILVDASSPEQRPDYADFLKLPEVETLDTPSPEGPAGQRCRVRWRDRNDSLRGWFDPTTGSASLEFLDLSAALFDQYDARRDADPLERLYHLAALCPSAAWRVLRRRFDKAIARFDLAACQALVGLFDDPAFLDGPAHLTSVGEALPRPEFQRLIEVRDECRSRLRTSSFWSDEYYRTGTYIQRTGLVEALETVVGRPEGEGPWIFHLHGGGGRGKTMFVRWAIARWAVPRQVPCGLVDLGGQMFAEMAGEPVRVWLAFARQLSRQVPESSRALENLIQKLNEKRHRAAAGERVDSHRATDDASWDSDGFHSQFGSALSLHGPRPILIVLDTLEQGVLTAGRAVADLVRAFDHIRRRYCPALSLLLTGRYDFSEKVDGQERVPGFSADFGAATVTREVGLFDADEARLYLDERRGLGGDLRVDQVIELFKRSGASGAHPQIHPLKLALVADLLWENAQLKVEEIDRASIELTFLIDRLLLHVDFATRWALLFGAVPRRLTREFLQKVLSPALDRVLARGGLTIAEEAKYPEAIGRKRVLRGNKETEPPAPTDLWQTLVAHAAASSWVQLVRGPEEDAIELHPEVVEVVRLLARSDPGQFLDLHREALKFFEWVAEHRPAEWGSAIAEAIYHRFQLGQHGGAVTFWREQLAEAERRGRPDWRRDLAADLRGPDYIDDDLAPRTAWDGLPLLSPEAVAEACYEEADACVVIALWDRSSGARLTARGQVPEAYARFERAIEKVEGPDPVVPPARRELLRINLLRLSDEAGQRQALKLARALKDRVDSGGAGPADERDRLRVLATLAELASALEEPDAIELLAGAIRGAEGRPGSVRDEQLAELRQRLAETAIDRQDVGAARAAIDALRAVEGTPEYGLRIAVHALRFGLMCGAFGDVIREADQLDARTGSGPEGCHDLHLLVRLNGAEAALRRLQPLDALRRAEEVLGRLEEYRPPDPTELARRNWVDANARWFKARCLFALYDFDGGTAEMETALELAKAFSRSEGLAFGIRSTYVIALLREAGETATAREWLDGSEAPPPRPDSPEAFIAQLLASEVDEAERRHAPAVKRLEPLLQAARPDDDPPWWTIRLSIHCLALGHQVGRSRDLLITALARVSPVARWGYHRELARCPALDSMLTPEEAARLGLPPIDDLPARDLSIRSLYEAEFWRVFNRVDIAQAQLRSAAGRLIGRRESSFPLRPLLLAWQRLAPEPAPKEIDPAAAGLVRKLPGFLDEFAGWPMLCGAILIEQAERDLLRGDRKSARDRGEQAGRHLEKVRPPSGWAARWERLRVAFASAAPRPVEIHARPDPAAESRRINPTTDPLPVPLPLALRAATVEFRVVGRPDGFEAALDGGGFEPGVRRVNLEALDLPVKFVATGYEVAERLLKPGSPFWTKALSLIEPSVRHQLFHPPAPPGLAPADLRLVGDPQVQAIPWECTRLLPDPGTPPLGVAPGLRHVYRAVPKPLVGSGLVEWVRLALGRLQAEITGVEWVRLALGRLQAEITGKDVSAPDVEWVRLALGRLQGSDPRPGGNCDAATRSALVAFQEDHGLPADGVADAATRAALDGALLPIVGPASALIVGNPKVGMPKGSYDGGRLDLVYEECGFEPVFVARTREELPVGPLKGVASLVHLVVEVEEDGGDFYLVFDSPEDSRLPVPEPGSSKANRFRLLLPALDRLIRQVGSPGPGPVVVLQGVPAGPSPLECVRQVLLRNSFAARLLLLGNVQAVIATSGLPIVTDWLPLFSRQVAAGASVAVLARSLRELGTPGLATDDPRWAENLLLASTALFSHDPDTVPRRAGNSS